MRVFFFLGQTFFEQSLSICREIQAEYPNTEFRAIVAARSNLMDELDRTTSPKFASYVWLSELERQWLDTPLDRKKLAEYEKKLGTNILRQMIISDREVGYGFVSGGYVERTQLIDEILADDDAPWRYIVGILDYYFQAFEQHRPDVIFAYCVAGTVAFALGAVADYLGIPFVQPVMARVRDYYIMDDNNYWLLNPVKTLYLDAMKNPSLVEEKLPEAREFIETFRSRPISPVETVTWIGEIRKNNTLTGLLRTTAIDLARWGAILLGLKGTAGVLRQRKGQEILKCNWSIFWNIRKTLNGKMPFFTKNTEAEGGYLYFPLHVDPEASTMVLADKFTDQLAVIEAIAKSMPAGMKLFVKEHIPVVGKRPQGFYERIAHMPDVRLLDPFVNNFELIKNAKLVCTITGTAGWESMLLGKAPLVIGNVHYLSIGEGFVHSQNLAEIGTAITQGLQAKPVSNIALETYIATMMTLGIRISPNDMWYEKYADMDQRAQAVKKMAQHIITVAKQTKTNVVSLKKRAT